MKKEEKKETAFSEAGNKKKTKTKNKRTKQQNNIPFVLHHWHVETLPA